MTSKPRNIDWPWTVGGTNDEVEVPLDMARERRPFVMPKGEIPEPGEVSEEDRLEQEVYTPRQISTPNSDLCITYFAEENMSRADSTALIWERLCAKALIDERMEQVIPDAQGLANILREGATTELQRSQDVKLAEAMRRTAQILGAIPTCPQCQGWLIYRRPDQRFMENSNYVQCQYGHVYELVPPIKIPGVTVGEIMKVLTSGSGQLDFHKLQEPARIEALEDAIENKQVVTFRYRVKVEVGHEMHSVTLSPYKVTGDITESNVRVGGWDHNAGQVLVYNVADIGIVIVSVDDGSEYHDEPPAG